MQFHRGAEVALMTFSIQCRQSQWCKLQCLCHIVGSSLKQLSEVIRGSLASNSGFLAVLEILRIAY